MNSIPVSELKSKKLEIKDLPISWYCLNVLQSLSVEKPREDRIHFIKNVFQQTDLGGNVIDFLTYDFHDLCNLFA